MRKKLSKSFFQDKDVVLLAKKLLGKRLCTNFDGIFTSGIITETEAYAGIADKASHAYGGRFTDRTKVMYEAGGTAYIYLCYGLHHLFNVVTNKKGTPHAILIRAVYPDNGVEHMLTRRKKKKQDKTLTAGPGSVAQALGITTKFSGTSLMGQQIWIEDAGLKVEAKDILAGPRVGVDYAGKDAGLPYRFVLKKTL
ncbi:MAG TPA: DNA-3-methyladenine glycosylase [Bacteroidia bacterium]|nr:DNA-3-methyladenine glycosylase [Bacteroidia bacterium]